MQRAAPRSASDASSGIAPHIAATKSAHMVVGLAIAHVFHREINSEFRYIDRYHIKVVNFVIFRALRGAEPTTTQFARDLY